MKQKVLSLILCIGFLLMVGCSSADTAQTPSDSTSTANSEEAIEPTKVTLYLTRHGKTMLNTADRVQGWADAPLTEPGVEVAKKLGQGLKKEGILFDAAHSSDSGRSTETTEIVLSELGQADLPFTTHKELREWNFGGFEGEKNMVMWGAALKTLGKEEEGMEAMQTMTLQEMSNAIAASDEAGLAEDWDTLSNRIFPAFSEIAKQSSAEGKENVLIVSHGLTIMTILNHIDPSLALAPLENASVTIVTYENDTFTIEKVGDLSYVEGAE